MPIDTQTFALSRWWANAGLISVKKNPSIFSNAQLRSARVELIAGKNQLTAIKNWLLAAQLIKKEANVHQVSRFGKSFLDNDPKFMSSRSWWAFHLMCCMGEDPYPYDALFKSLDADIRSFIGISELKKKILDLGPGISSSSLDTYLDGVLNMFRRDGSVEGLGIIEVTKHGRGTSENTGDTNSWRIGRPIVPDRAILFGLALARQRHFVTRTSIDFSELVTVGLHQFLGISQDTLRQRLRAIGREDKNFTYTTAANLDSISFDNHFSIDGILVTLLQEGADTWM